MATRANAKKQARENIRLRRIINREERYRRSLQESEKALDVLNYFEENELQRQTWA